MLAVVLSVKQGVLRCVNEPERTIDRNTALSSATTNVVDTERQSLTDPVDNYCLFSTVLREEYSCVNSVGLAIDILNPGIALKYEPSIESRRLENAESIHQDTTTYQWRLF